MKINKKIGLPILDVDVNDKRNNKRAYTKTYFEVPLQIHLLQVARRNWSKKKKSRNTWRPRDNIDGNL